MDLKVLEKNEVLRHAEVLFLPFMLPLLIFRDDGKRAKLMEPALKEASSGL